VRACSVAALAAEELTRDEVGGATALAAAQERRTLEPSARWPAIWGRRGRDMRSSWVAALGAEELAWGGLGRASTLRAVCERHDVASCGQARQPAGLR